MSAAMRVRPVVASLLGLSLLSRPGKAADALQLDPADPRFVGRQDLLLKLKATPHGYFRFVNAAFAAETCSLFKDVVDQMPDMNLHGDAHIEQYTVTNLGRGLSDFDDCTRGKAVIDLVRLGASLLIAARERAWTDQEEKFVSDFLHGYRDGLGSDRVEMRTPEIVTRIRASFTWDHAGALRQANALIDKAPLPNDSLADGVARFNEVMHATREHSPGLLQGQADRRAHDGRRQRARREVPDPVRGPDRLRTTTTWSSRRSRSATSRATRACARMSAPRACSTARG